MRHGKPMATVKNGNDDEEFYKAIERMCQGPLPKDRVQRPVGLAPAWDIIIREVLTSLR